MNQARRFLLVMTGAVILLGILPLLEKQAVRQSSSLFSLTVALNLVTVVILAVPGWRQRPPVLYRQWRDVALIGLLASGVVALLNLTALQTTSATHRSVFQAMYPASAALFSFWLLRERLPLMTYLVIAVMGAGIILMSSTGLKLEMAFGDLLLFATLPLMGFCDTWVKKSVRDLAPAWVALCRFVFGTLLLVVVGTATGNFTAFPEPAAWPWLVASGLCIGGGILLLYEGIELRGAALAAAMVGMSPVVTLVLEWHFFDAGFVSLELAGMAIVTTGGVLLSRPRFQGR